jgi:hypothetical protein
MPLAQNADLPLTSRCSVRLQDACSKHKPLPAADLGAMTSQSTPTQHDSPELFHKESTAPRK